MAVFRKACSPDPTAATPGALRVYMPQSLAVHQGKRTLKGWTWGLVTVDIASPSGDVERISITLPSRVLRRIDQAAKSTWESRSGYIARRALA